MAPGRGKCCPRGGHSPWGRRGVAHPDGRWPRLSSGEDVHRLMKNKKPESAEGICQEPWGRDHREGLLRRLKCAGVTPES